MNTSKKYFIIDFDSTFVQTETLEELANIVLDNNPEKDKILKKMKLITDLGMEGKISFERSLAERLKLLKTNKKDLLKVTRVLKKKISRSVKRNKKFFISYRDSIYIISGGFKEIIIPLVRSFHIEESHVLANTFIFDRKGNITGYDKKNPLAQKKGKVRAVRNLKLKGDIFVIGDGYTDFEIKEMGAAKKFVAFTENIRRQSVIEKADHIAPSFDEFLFVNRLPTSISYPKNRMKILLMDNIDESAETTFREEGFQVERGDKIFTNKDLEKKIQESSVICVRSNTALPTNTIEATKKLICIGRFGIGVDHIDLKTATSKGVAVFNAPFSNTRSVVEYVMGSIIALFRRTFDANNNLHKGLWKKSSKKSYEVRNKTLGIVGYGNIGSQLSMLAEAFGMRVIFYDLIEKMPIGNAQRKVTLDEVLKESDILSVHLSGNKSLIGEREFSKMKNGCLIINTSRGKVVDINVLARYLKQGKVQGAAIDVFPNEPKVKGALFTSPLQNLENVILTPHIAGNTVEAQKDISHFVCNKILEYINTGNTYLSVNLPNIQLPKLVKAHRLLHLHSNVPGMLAQINGIIAKNNINILGQYLKTNDQVGYVITDVDRKYDKQVLQELKQIPNTIRFRVLY